MKEGRLVRSEELGVRSDGLVRSEELGVRSYAKWSSEFNESKEVTNPCGSTSTPHSSLLTPNSKSGSTSTPHSSLLTPNCSSLFTPQSLLSPRPIDSHKGTFGTVLVIGGCRGMYGAPSLCASATLTSGCGLTRVAIPQVCQEVVASYDRQYTTIGLPCDDFGKLTYCALDLILEEVHKASAVALGPGLGQSEELTKLVCKLNRQVDKPMVVDADALNALSKRPECISSPFPRVFTPHPGEFARLVATEPSALRQREEQLDLAVTMAKQNQLVLVLKGHGTLVTDGEQKYINSTGNPGMATGGSGDVLTGIIASLLAQGYSPFESAQMGVYIHGLAGDIAAQHYGQISVTAERVLECLPEAFKKITKNNFF